MVLRKYSVNLENISESRTVLSQFTINAEVQQIGKHSISSKYECYINSYLSVAKKLSKKTHIVLFLNTYID